MIIEYIRYRLAQDSADSFVDAYERASSSLRASCHCLGFDLARCVEDPLVFVLRIEWDSPEGHLEGFRKSAEFRAFFAEVRPYVDAIEEMRHYALTKVSSR